MYVRTLSGRAGWTDPERLALLGQGPTDVGDPNAFPLDPDRAHKVEIDFGGRTWSAMNEEIGVSDIPVGIEVNASVGGLDVHLGLLIGGGLKTAPPFTPGDAPIADDLMEPNPQGCSEEDCIGAKE